MRLSTTVLGMIVATGLFLPQGKAIDTKRSTISIHVGKAGLFSVAAHDHTVIAPIASGTITDSEPRRVEFRIETAKMSVKPDPKVDAKDQASIQSHMEELVLETKKFPEITFRSTRVQKLPDGQWKVDGDLTLHGITRQVSLTVKQNGDSYTTRSILKQTDYGITPISIAGGMIKVKNELEIDFQIFAR